MLPAPLLVLLGRIRGRCSEQPCVSSLVCEAVKRRRRRQRDRLSAPPTCDGV